MLERVQVGGLLRAEDRYIALVSGGRDSVCLFDLMLTLHGSATLTVLHVNYGLRAGESEADELHVRGLCERAAVEYVVHRADPAPARGNLQAWARDVRYGEAGRLALAREAQILTGHTASDQLETVLYRLAASPGRRALLGMAARDGRLIRPLLTTSRAETAAYCRARGLGWRDDATNSDERFARGRVRHGLLEQLRRVHPAAEANVLRSAELLREEAAVLDEVLTTTLGGRSQIALAELGRLPAALARLIVVRLAEDGVLRFERREPTATLAEVALALPGTTAFGAWALRSELCQLAGEQALQRLSSDGSVGVLDADLLVRGELTVRAWRAGDRVRAIGLPAAKSLADLFTDRRLPRAERRCIPVVACAGEIVWVPGVATAEHVRVRADTELVAVLTARRS